MSSSYSSLDWVLSHWAHFTVCTAYMLYYCEHGGVDLAGLLPARLMGVPAQSSLPGHGQPRDLAQRNEASIRLGAIPNTVQGSQLHITHTHRQLGMRNGPNKVASALWLSNKPALYEGRKEGRGGPDGIEA